MGCFIFKFLGGHSLLTCIATYASFIMHLKIINNMSKSILDQKFSLIPLLIQANGIFSAQPIEVFGFFLEYLPIVYINSVFGDQKNKKKKCRKISFSWSTSTNSRNTHLGLELSARIVRSNGIIFLVPKQCWVLTNLVSLTTTQNLWNYAYDFTNCTEDTQGFEEILLL